VRLVVWRHGQSEWNAAARFQGQTDIDLTETGRAQAAAAAVALAELRPEVIVSSDLKRAAHTAAELAALTGLEVVPDPRLRERYFGQWQGCTLAEVEARWPAEFARWRAGGPVLGCGVENLEDLGKRAAAAMREAVERAPSGTVVVATHGAAAREGCTALLGWPEHVGRTLATLDNCHWAELNVDPVRGWVLRRYNVGAGEGDAAKAPAPAPAEADA
jgi:probable phosphoglycerate mutase